MKARRVESDPSQLGEYEYRIIPGVAEGIAYCCPGCGDADYLPIRGPGDLWTFDGNVDAPTLTPSVLHRPCGWHGYLTRGEWTPC